MKMVPPAGSSGVLHTPHASYDLFGQPLVEVLEADVPELQALGWRSPLYANSPEKILTDEENACQQDALRRSMWRRLEHPEVKNRMVLQRGAIREVTVDGREYSIPEGHDFVDVAAEDARFIVCNRRWLDLGRVGATEDRPVNPEPQARPFGPPAMTTFIDTDLGRVVFFDGELWRDSVTGAEA